VDEHIRQRKVSALEVVPAPLFNNIVSTATSLIVGIDDPAASIRSGDKLDSIVVTTTTGAISSTDVVVMSESVFAAIAIDVANVHPTTKDDTTCALFSSQIGGFHDESTT
jgi:hypothetical protein